MQEEFNKAQKTIAPKDLAVDGIHPTKAIELNSASILESVSYELGNLVLRFRMTDNTTNEVRNYFIANKNCFR